MTCEHPDWPMYLQFCGSSTTRGALPIQGAAEDEAAPSPVKGDAGAAGGCCATATWR